MQKLEFKVKSFKKFENPYDPTSDVVKYRFYVSVLDVPEDLQDWMETNPRGQNIDTDVSGEIKNTLYNNKDNFYLLNRGILVSAKSISFDNQSGIAKMVLEDTAIHGNIDGGHTMKIILNERSLLKDSDVVPYVEFEVITGLLDTVQLAEARNTSVQVARKSIAELNQLFRPIKEILNENDFTKKFINRIEWHQNEFVDKGIKNIIDSREVIAIINMFNRKFYPIDSKGLNHPIQSYTGKEVSLQKYLKLVENGNFEEIYNMREIIPSLFMLWEMIEIDLPKVSSKIGKKYGSKDYSRYKEINEKGKLFYSLFGDKKLDYVVPKGLMYPIMSSFRAMIKIDDTGKYSWKKNIDILKYWQDNSLMMIQAVMQTSEEKANNPNAIGKASQLWDNLLQKNILQTLVNMDNI